jgi:hypothetical protein
MSANSCTCLTTSPISQEANGTLATQRAIDEADIRRRMDEWAKAIRTMDLDGVTSNYAPDIASFDLGPPLRHAGAEAKRKNWVGVFASIACMAVRTTFPSISAIPFTALRPGKSYSSKITPCALPVALLLVRFGAFRTGGQESFFNRGHGMVLVRHDPFSIQLAKADGKTQIKRTC